MLLTNDDICEAYRLIAIHPHNRHLGMSCDNQLYLNLALPFGSAPFIFNQFAEAWHWILHHRHGIRYLLHYLDDYSTAGAPNSRECQNNFSSIRSSASSLGSCWPWRKLKAPVQFFLSWAPRWILAFSSPARKTLYSAKSPPVLVSQACLSPSRVGVPPRRPPSCGESGLPWPPHSAWPN